MRVLERLAGLSGGIGELAERLEVFMARLQNAPPAGAAKQDLPPQSIVDNIATAEQRLRYCLELVAKINDAF